MRHGHHGHQHGERHRHARDEGHRHGREDGHRHGRHGHDEHRGGRHGGPGRFFEHGDLRLVVLALLAEKPRHGYEIIKAIEERAGGAYSPSPGVIYPTLTLLEEIGHATVADGEGGRKLHSLTVEGEQHLAANRPAVDAILARMAEIAAARRDTDAPPLRRAFENLRMALRLRTSRGPLAEAEIRAIASALDAAAVAIEHS